MLTEPKNNEYIHVRTVRIIYIFFIKNYIIIIISMQYNKNNINQTYKLSLK